MLTDSKLSPLLVMAAEAAIHASILNYGVNNWKCWGCEYHF
jgi:hypothetical protein